MLPNLADTYRALQKLPWVEPTEPYVRVAELRKQALDLLFEPVLGAVTAAWAPFIPDGAQRELHRRIKRGLRYSIECLTLSTTKTRRTVSWDFDLPVNITSVPSYWEPPVADEPDLPQAQLQAYRWAASILAFWVRNQLEELHGKYTDDECMPTLNRGVRAATYSVLLANPYVAWELSAYLRVITGCAALKVPGIKLPLAAGT